MATKKKTTQKKKTNVRRATPRKAGRTSARPAKGAKSQGLRLTEASPSFTVNDLDASLAFYRDVLGFVIKDRWERDGKLMGVELGAGAVTFYVGQDDWKKGRDRAKGEGFRLYCSTTQDIDALAATIKARGGKLAEEPHDQPWGGRAMAVSDPDGFKITLSKD
jgi:uncharacterized glyoxalase superfamily protein PhnB